MLCMLETLLPMPQARMAAISVIYTAVAAANSIQHAMHSLHTSWLALVCISGTLDSSGSNSLPQVSHLGWSVRL
jgi:hypothetical protein